MDPAKEAGQGRRRAYLACRQCRSRKIKCDATRPVCVTCIRRRSPKCEYDDEQRRRGPDRHPRVRTHHDSGPPPSSIRPHRSQKWASNDVIAIPITPSTESPPCVTSDAGASTSGTVLSNSSLIPPGGSFGSVGLYPSPGEFTPFHQGSMSETPTRDLFGRSDASSVVNSISVLHPDPSPSTGTLDRNGHLSLLLNPSDERPYLSFSRRSLVDTGPHSPYLPDNDPPPSSESPYSLPVMPMQVVATGDRPRQAGNEYCTFYPISWDISIRFLSGGDASQVAVCVQSEFFADGFKSHTGQSRV
ncbi:hypothetical protein BS47DRAFT_1085001 [Hydnum rufescens UP504]|uniref:Zn(2)-C6 fungal-type domain-containing protein n=1 Tax=Hydnum rufescens UP504 TaxID=1448309 RepID=A0A9P6B8J7_9AGAM|nr:hypothetical protein BS47DRAFT_1085001 [Hydnum rufescens UP504]